MNSTENSSSLPENQPIATVAVDNLEKSKSIGIDVNGKFVTLHDTLIRTEQLLSTIPQVLNPKISCINTLTCLRLSIIITDDWRTMMIENQKKPEVSDTIRTIILKFREKHYNLMLKLESLSTGQLVKILPKVEGVYDTIFVNRKKIEYCNETFIEEKFNVLENYPEIKHAKENSRTALQNNSYATDLDTDDPKVAYPAINSPKSTVDYTNQKPPKLSLYYYAPEDLPCVHQFMEKNFSRLFKIQVNKPNVVPYTFSQSCILFTFITIDDRWNDIEFWTKYAELKARETNNNSVFVRVHTDSTTGKRPTPEGIAKFSAVGNKHVEIVTDVKMVFNYNDGSGDGGKVLQNENALKAEITNIISNLK